MDNSTKCVCAFASAALVALGCASSSKAPARPEDDALGPTEDRDAMSPSDGGGAVSDGAPGDESDHAIDSGWPWQACNGSRGMTLSCDSTGARPITVSRFDRERRCYEAATTLEGFCAVPTYCPGGGGTVACVVDAEADVYTALVLWGEEVSSGWHHSDGPDLGSTLTEADAALCREMGNGTAAADDQADSVILGSGISGVFVLKPACSGEGISAGDEAVRILRGDPEQTEWWDLTVRGLGHAYSTGQSVTVVVGDPERAPERIGRGKTHYAEDGTFELVFPSVWEAGLYKRKLLFIDENQNGRCDSFDSVYSDNRGSQQPVLTLSESAPDTDNTVFRESTDRDADCARLNAEFPEE